MKDSKTLIPVPYTGLMRMRRLIADNPMLLAALTRFNISLGFGDATVEEVCASAGVDCATFLTVANFISGYDADYSSASPGPLMDYLRNAHSYYLEYVVPNIRHLLLQSISAVDGSRLSLALIRFFDEYVAEMRRHMDYEDKVVFSYVSDVLQGRPASPDFKFDDFKDSHSPIHGKLTELKDLLVCHFTAEEGRVNHMNRLLYEIVTLERDLSTHCRLEDAIFIPLVKSMKGEKGKEITSGKSAPLNDNGDVVLTEREKEIVANVARGLSNKEIAEKLFLSVHTVATHRRNICAKLDLHSSSALTLYGIMHSLV